MAFFVPNRSSQNSSQGTEPLSSQSSCSSVEMPDSIELESDQDMADTEDDGPEANDGDPGSVDLGRGDYVGVDLGAASGRSGGAAAATCLPSAATLEVARIVEEEIAAGPPSW